MATAKELDIKTNVGANDLAQTMFGTGIKIVSASYSGAALAKGIYSGADTTAPGLAPADSGVILSTGKVTDITNSSGDANISNGMTTNHGLKGDADLNEMAGSQTYDAAVFKAEFVPEGSMLSMQLTFSSEEYLEYVNSGFNDAFGVWVNGTKAVLAVGDGDITINNINNVNNSNLYIDNPSKLDAINTEMDGVTVTLTLKAKVKPGEVNNIKIAIADGGDAAYDSNVMIAANSVQTALIAGDDDVTIKPGSETVVDVLSNDASAMDGKLTITHINGQAVAAGDTVKLGPGTVVTLNPDGTMTLQSDGSDQPNSFSYTVADQAGNTDTAFVKTKVPVPCFVAGTLVDTPGGPVPVEFLRPGDAVSTLDGGWATVRWVGIATRRAEGRDAPVTIPPGVLAAERELSLSPQHRVLLAGPHLSLLFGSDQVLTRAKDLVRAGMATIRQDGSPVRYVHLMFGRHEILRTHGVWSESYHPGPQTLSAFDTEAREELLRLFPDLASIRGDHWGHPARMSLKSGEAEVALSALRIRPTGLPHPAGAN
jgi:hypothetical protein